VAGIQSAAALPSRRLISSTAAPVQNFQATTFVFKVNVKNGALKIQAGNPRKRHWRLTSGDVGCIDHGIRPNSVADALDLCVLTKA
jgi:hypothetical protein